MSGQRGQHSTERMSAVLLVAGAGVGLVGNGLHPHIVVVDVAARLREIAESRGWVAIHLAIIVAILLVIGGLVGFAHILQEGPAGPLARLGLAAAVIGGSIVCVSLAIDGFVMKALALAWTSASAVETSLVLQLAVGVRQLDDGIWSVGMLVLFGVAFMCFGAATNASGRYPWWFGWSALGGGAGSTIAALFRIANNGDTQAAETLFLASSLLITLWAFGLGILLWRATGSSGSSIGETTFAKLAGR